MRVCAHGIFFGFRLQGLVLGLLGFLVFGRGLEGAL